MSKARHGSASGTKSGRCLIRQSIPQNEAQLVAVMQRVKGSLRNDKPAIKLELLTDQPRSNCEKMISGNRLPNPAMLAALFGTELIIDAILGLIPEDATNPKVRAVRRAMRRLELDFEDER